MDEEQKHVQFSRAFLMGYDNSLVKAHEKEELRCANGMQLVVLLAVSVPMLL